MNMRNVKELGARLTNGTKAKAGIDAATIRELADLLTETGLTEIEVEQGGTRLRVARQLAPVTHTAPATVARMSSQKNEMLCVPDRGE